MLVHHCIVESRTSSNDKVVLENIKKFENSTEDYTLQHIIIVTLVLYHQLIMTRLRLFNYIKLLHMIIIHFSIPAIV